MGLRCAQQSEKSIVRAEIVEAQKNGGQDKLC